MPKNSPSRFTMVPLRKSTEPTAARRARMIIGGLALVAVTGPLALGVSMASANKAVDFSQVDPQGRAIADAAAFQMSAAQTLKIPTAQSFDPESLTTPRDVTGSEAVDLPYPVDSVTWTGFDANTFTDGSTNQQFEVHKYLLVPDMDEYVGEWLESQSGSSSRSARAAETEAPAEPDLPEEPPAPAPAPAPEGDGDEPPAPAPEDEGGNVSMTTEDTTEQDVPEEEEGDIENVSGTEQEAILKEGVTPYQLEVPVVLTNDGPRLAGAPALAPWTAAEATPSGRGDYSNFQGLREEANTQTAKQVGRWAVAYAEDDRETLLSLTGDADPKHTYAGLGGWSVPNSGVPVQVLYAVGVNEGNQLLRVRVLLEDDRTDTASNENAYRMYSDFDVLVNNPASATPQIVAWGAAGAGASLSPYSNAITK